MIYLDEVLGGVWLLLIVGLVFVGVLVLILLFKNSVFIFGGFRFFFVVVLVIYIGY